jgi:xylitol oxidase
MEMKKREFIKLSSLLVTGSALSPLAPWEAEDKLKNWAGNYEYSTTKLDAPKSFEEVQQFIKSHQKFKVLGTRHCFNGIADSHDRFVSLKNLDHVEALDTNAHTVTVDANVRYGQLAEYLQAKGYALHNLASLPHISVAGACATATHGSGLKNGNLSTAVAAMEMITAAGDVIMLSRERDAEKFNAAVVHLGGLGVITKVTLDIQPTYNVQQDVYTNLPLDELKDHFNDVMSSGYSVSLFTDWAKPRFNQVWIKQRLKEGETIKAEPEFYGAKAATRNMHPIDYLSAENCTEQMGVPGPWHERLPHFKMGFTPSSGKELQSEYFVPHEHSYEALVAVNKLGAQIAPLLQISEIRTIDADHFWMSPCYKQASTTIHFTWKQDWPAVKKLLPLIEEQLAPFNAKPHWGKLFTVAPSRLKSLYEKMGDFQQMLKEHDPQGKFRNDFLNTNIFGA